MSIKKSFLEQKLYYRILKVFFWALPLIIGLVFYFQDGVIFLGVLTENIIFVIIGYIAYILIIKGIWRLVLYIGFGGLEDDTKKKIETVVQPVGITQSVQTSNQTGPIVGVILFIIIVFIIVFFMNGSGTNPFNSFGGNTYGSACTNSKGVKGLYGTNGNCITCSSGSSEATNPIGNCSAGVSGVYCCSSGTSGGGGSKSSGCIPTGCGNGWYCSGHYYLNNSLKNVSGCFTSNPTSGFSSWVGICRQCP